MLRRDWASSTEFFGIFNGRKPSVAVAPLDCISPQAARQMFFQSPFGEPGDGELLDKQMLKMKSNGSLILITGTLQLPGYTTDYLSLPYSTWYPLP